MYKKDYVIYCIENKINGKKYIGKATSFKGRKAYHMSKLRNGIHDNDYLQKSYNLHGEENFIIYVVEECNMEDLSEREIFYIKEWNTKTPNGYNLTDGGDGSYGYKHTPENILKISKNRDYKSGEEHPFFNKHHTEETKILISEKNKSNPIFGIMRRGKKVTEESKKKMSDAKMGKPIKKDRNNFSSKYYGVSFSKKDNRWRVYKTVNGKTKALGSFIEEIDAAKKWDEYIIENNLRDLFPLNFPEENNARW